MFSFRVVAKDPQSETKERDDWLDVSIAPLSITWLLMMLLLLMVMMVVTMFLLLLVMIDVGDG